MSASHTSSLDHSTQWLDLSQDQVLQDADVYSFFARINQPVPRCKLAGQAWRLTPPLVGEVLGLPGLRGRARATDGIILMLETEMGKVHRVHMASFIPDKGSSENSILTRKPKAKDQKHSAPSAAIVSAKAVKGLLDL